MSDTEPDQAPPNPRLPDQEPDEAVGDFGDDDQSDAGGDSDPE
jgi:hypothetical protein